ncbi:MAG: hypothetical protein AB7G11_14380 [Phycisphaerales bacterium]
MKKPLVRIVVLLVVALIAVGGLLGYYASKRAGDIKKWKAEGTTKLEDSDLYKQDKAYFMTLYNHAQPLAEKSVNGLLKPGVSEEDYYTALLTEMARQAKRDSKIEWAQKIRTYGTRQRWNNVTFE